MATDPDFTNIVRQSGDGFEVSEPQTADPANDYTFKLDVGGLSAGTTYFYRFTALGQTSPVGRTAPDRSHLQRLLPRPVERLRARRRT